MHSFTLRHVLYDVHDRHSRLCPICSGGELSNDVASLIQTSTIAQAAFSLSVIGREFGVGHAPVQWVAASSAIPWGALQLVAGRLCDVYGRRRGFIVGSAVSAVFCVISAFMPVSHGQSTPTETESTKSLRSQSFRWSGFSNQSASYRRRRRRRAPGRERTEYRNGRNGMR